MKQLIDFFRKNPLDKQLEKARKRAAKRALITWNRGLGDIALGLYALVYQVRKYLPDCDITFITRTDLAPGFALLPNVSVLDAKEWKRGVPFDLKQSLANFNLTPDQFDLVLENPDVTKWLKWQLGTLTPKLNWNSSWDPLWKKFTLKETERYACVHVQTETNYNYEKNWPESSWRELFDRLWKEEKIKVILFGFRASPAFEGEGIIDLRGKTSLLEMLSIIKERCSFLIVPDSGVLSLTYFLAVTSPIKIISLWADPRQGVLKQNVASPNPNLLHLPLIGPDGMISQISVNAVMEKLHAS